MNTQPTQSPQPGAKIEVRDLLVERGGRPVLDIAAFDVSRGLVTAVIGPNGSGKSTLLGVLQLLIKPRRGQLLLDGAPMWSDALATRRRLAAAFQEPLLLNTSVLKNLETALGLRKLPRKQRRPRALHWLGRFGVEHLADRHARALSGGEAQRVSLARAFSLEPEVLLLDEPFSALDAPTRAALIDDFASIISDTAVTTVIVTHDRDEALRLADRVAVLIDGSVRQIGTPGAVFGAPADEDVAAFVGVENVWPARLAPPHAQVGSGVATYRVGAHEVEVATDNPAPAGLFCIRPEEVTLFTDSGELADTADTPGPAGMRDTPGPAGMRDRSGSARNRLHARVERIDPAGPVLRLRLVLAGGASPPIHLVATLTRPSVEALGLDVGSRVIATFKATAAHVIPQPVPKTGL